VEDLGRTIDYLESRPEEFDTSRIGHLGQSYGAMMSPTLLVAEPRIRTAVFLSTGVLPPLTVPEEVHPSIYAPRVSIPVLMLNGRDDYIFPYETSQIVLFNLLGTPENDKRLVSFDGGHVNLLSNMDLVRETVDWLDRYLGPVGTSP
jgi:dienelactone hydrolase